MAFTKEKKKHPYFKLSSVSYESEGQEFQKKIKTSIKIGFLSLCTIVLQTKNKKQLPWGLAWHTETIISFPYSLAT